MEAEYDVHRVKSTKNENVYLTDPVCKILISHVTGVNILIYQLNI